MTDALVIGAGIAGLTAAREVARAGLSVTVVEGRERVGGRVYSVRDFCDAPVEGGAEFVHGVDAQTGGELEAAGLRLRPCPQSRALFNLGGATRWLPWLLVHPGVWPSFTILRAVAKLQPPDLSAREFIERRGYRGRARLLAEMVLTAHLPASIDEVGVLGLVDDGVLTLETGLNHRVTEGYDRLPAFLAEGLDIRCGLVVEEVEWAHDRVTVRAATGEELSAHAAVCTLPVGVLASGRVRFVPALPRDKQAALSQIVMGPVCKLLMRFAAAFWPQWATMIGCGVGPVTLYWPVFHGRADGPPVLIAYCTGSRAARLSELSEEQAADVVLADLARLFPGADPRRQLLASRRIDWTTDPFALGGYTFLRPGGVGARARLAAADTGTLFWAGSATVSRPRAATVEAAYLSGLRAAAEVRAAVAGPAAA